ncbi:heterokaryon incompatibility protein-domain-containing protein [Hyaloscypha finlandica]|nr:heterokaryon incompatibility protein-domain-containing protein [Hyaloscypha finlandica]
MSGQPLMLGGTTPAYIHHRSTRAKAGNPPVNQNLEPVIYATCECCRGISIDTLVLPGGHRVPIKYQWEKRVKFSNNRCLLCSSLYQRAVGLDIHQGSLVLRPKHSVLLSPKPYAELITYSGDSSDCFHRMIPLYTVEGDPAQEIGVPLLDEWLNTSSDRSFEIVNHWINACDKNHDCLSEDLWLNTGIGAAARLIDVSKIGDTMDVRIVEFSKAETRPRYATLSYCWGVDPSSAYSTTLSSLKARKERLSYVTLPLTIQHAIDIARNLKLRYLWVDALCIIQDSEDDWKTEAAKMGSIYARSYLTIAVDSAQGANEGCFNIRKEFRVSFCESKCTLADGRESVLYIPVDKIRYPPPPRERKNEPLSQRGWTLQERMLSPRVLHYTAQQLYWECRSRPRLEEESFAFCCKDPLVSFGGISYNGSRGLIRRLNLDDPRDKVLAVWYLDLISKDYSGRKLRFATDTLSAISGMATLVNTKLKSEYLAGMWLDGLEWALLWFRTPSENSLPRKEQGQYVAPSWSWASVSGPVSWRLGIRYPNAPPRFVIEEAMVKLSGDDTFGAVEKGSLKINGFLVHARLAKLSPKTNVIVNDWVLAGVSLDYSESVGPVSLLLLFNPPGGKHFYMLLRQVEEQPEKYCRVGLLVNDFSVHEDPVSTRQAVTII